MKFTAKSIAALKPKSERYEVWEDVANNPMKANLRAGEFIHESKQLK